MTQITEENKKTRTAEEVEVLKKTHPFRVRTSLDQLSRVRPQYVEMFQFEPSMKGYYHPNQVTARFTSREEAEVIYWDLNRNGFIVFRNWFDKVQS